MKCRHVQESLHLYISNEVSEKERESIDTHLGECAECRNALMRIQETVHALHSDKDIELSPGYMTRLRWKLQHVENDKTRRLVRRGTTKKNITNNFHSIIHSYQRFFHPYDVHDADFGVAEWLLHHQ